MFKIIHYRNVDTILIKELVKPDEDVYGLRIKQIEGYISNYVPQNSVVF